MDIEVTSVTHRCELCDATWKDSLIFCPVCDSTLIEVRDWTYAPYIPEKVEVITAEGFCMDCEKAIWEAVIYGRCPYCKGTNAIWQSKGEVSGV